MSNHQNIFSSSSTCMLQCRQEGLRRGCRGCSTLYLALSCMLNCIHITIAGRLGKIRTAGQHVK
eukprot:1143659-Pelagomonas_calceolata.AAC.2